MKNVANEKEKSILVGRKQYSKVIPFILLIVLEFIFFRNIIFTTGLVGNRMDGRYTNLIAEHWYNYFSGKESLGYIPEFYPLTYWGFTSSDLLMLNGVIHSMFRFLGFGIYDAYKWALILIHFFGTICMYVLLNRKLSIKSSWTLVGTCIFSFSNNYAIKIYHTQLIVFSIIPFMLILMVCFVNNYRIRYKRNICVFSLISVMAIGVYTGWYMIYYFVLFWILSLLVYSFMLKTKKMMSWKTQLSFIKEMGIDIVYYFIFGIIVLMPFFCVYLPALGQNNGGWSWETTAYYIPTFKDIVNYESGHLIFGKLFYFNPFDTTETLGGISPIVLICIVTALIKSVTMRKNKKSTFIYELFLSGFIVSLVLFVCTIRVDNTYVSLWYLFYKFCPAASSLRAVGRMWLFLTLPFAIYISYIFNIAYEDALKRDTLIAGGILLSLVVLFDFRIDGVYSEWSSDTERSHMSQIGANIPEDADLFFIINTDEAMDEFAIPDEFHIEALAIAEQFDLCTINGYTGVYPDNYWGLLWYVTNENYIYGVAEWVRLHNLAERGFDYIYQYDIYTNTWTKLAFE